MFSRGICSAKEILISILIVFIIFIIPFMLGFIGGGDIKLYFGIGALLANTENFIYVMLLSILIGAVYGLVLIVKYKSQKRLINFIFGLFSGSFFKYEQIDTEDRKYYIPYSVPISIATLLVMLVL